MSFSDSDTSGGDSYRTFGQITRDRTLTNLVILLLPTAVSSSSVAAIFYFFFPFWCTRCDLGLLHEMLGAAKAADSKTWKVRSISADSRDLDPFVWCILTFSFVVGTGADNGQGYSQGLVVLV